jgi:hypothetical protein
VKTPGFSIPIEEHTRYNQRTGKQVPTMTAASLKIGRKSFVVVPERDFERMARENARYRQLLNEDQALGKLAEKELKSFRKKGGKGVPWEQVKKELGL